MVLELSKEEVKLIQNEYYSAVKSYHHKRKILERYNSIEDNRKPEGIIEAYNRLVQTLRNYVILIRYIAMVEDIELEDIEIE